MPATSDLDRNFLISSEILVLVERLLRQRQLELKLQQQKDLERQKSEPDGEVPESIKQTSKDSKGTVHSITLVVL